MYEHTVADTFSFLNYRFALGPTSKTVSLRTSALQILSTTSCVRSSSRPLRERAYYRERM